MRIISSLRFLLLLELRKLNRQRVLSICFFAVALIAVAIALTSPRSYPLTDPRFAVRYLQTFVMLGGFLGIVNGALLAKTAGSFDSTEIELAAPTPYFITLGARFLAVMINVIFWPVVFCALLTGGQLISGTADVAITAGAIVLIGLFGLNSAVLMAFFISSLLPKSLGLIAGIAFWGYLIFVPNSFGIPTLNGSVFSLLGDQYCTRLFAVTPIFEGSYMGGSSLVLLAVVIMTLFVHILLFGAASTLIKGKVLK